MTTIAGIATGIELEADPPLPNVISGCWPPRSGISGIATMLAEIEPSERDDEAILEYRLACASLRRIAEHFNISVPAVIRLRATAETSRRVVGTLTDAATVARLTALAEVCEAKLSAMADGFGRQGLEGHCDNSDAASRSLVYVRNRLAKVDSIIASR